MIDFPYLSELVQKSDSKILMLVVDGLGGAPQRQSRRSELEAARVPNLDRLAQESACGLSTPVLPGIAPGSGPGHLGLFGYEPLKYLIGRGALEAIGIEMELLPGDVAARGNFATVDAQGNLTDRRAGRISSELAAPLAEKLNKITVPGVEIAVKHVKDYRFVLRLRGEGLSEEITETDPQRLGVPPLQVEPHVRDIPGVDAQGNGHSREARTLAARKTANAVNAFAAQAAEVLKNDAPANQMLLRGWSELPQLPGFGPSYQLNPAAIAAYPMYRGLARIIGMKVIPTGTDFAAEVATLKEHWAEHDYFYLHYKPADAAGEDGDFEKKKRALEALDAFIPALLDMKPDVLVICGDHATPSIYAAHSWHPVPVLLRSQWTLGEGVDRFNERSMRNGSLGTFEAKYIMLQALSHAGKLAKFGP